MYDAGILQAFQVRKPEHQVSATLLLGSECQQEGIMVQCTTTLLHLYHFLGLHNHLCIASFAVSMKGFFSPFIVRLLML